MAIPMAHMEPVIRCVDYAHKDGIADFILLGNRAKAFDIAGALNVDLNGVEFIECDNEEEACQQAALLVKSGAAQALMKGLAQTSTFLRALLDRNNCLVPENSLISQVSLFDIPKYHKALLLTDPGINILPDLDQKVKILQNALNISRTLGIEQPKVACVTPVEQVSTKIPSTVHAHELCSMENVFGNALIAGPYGFDIAVSRHAAQIKNISNPVAGDPDILLLPELNCANAVYKSLTFFGDATVAGVIAGLKVPVVLTSRSDTMQTKYLSMKLAFCIEPT